MFTGVIVCVFNHISKGLKRNKNTYKNGLTACCTFYVRSKNVLSLRRCKLPNSQKKKKNSKKNSKKNPLRYKNNCLAAIPIT